MAAAMCGIGVTAARAQSVPLNNVYTALPSISDAHLAPADEYANGPGGREGLLMLELEDDFDAVQIGTVNQFTSAWGIARIAVAASANYGGDKAIGSAAYDLDAVPVPALVPVQWSQGGAASSPPGNVVLSLPIAAAAKAGETTLDFASTNAPDTQGGGAPEPGWYAADGLGCVTDGARVRAVTQSSVSLNAGLARGCGAGQAIYFSPQPIGPFAQGVPAAAVAQRISLRYSDWLPLHSLPRTDGGFTPGATVVGTGIAPGTVLAGTDYMNLKLSKPLAATMPPHTAITLRYGRTLSAAAVAGTRTLSLNNVNGVRPGQTLSAGKAIAAGTHVVAIAGTQAALDRPLVSALGAGEWVQFTNRTWSVDATGAGTNLIATASTTSRPLLHVRFIMQPGFQPSVDRPACVRKSAGGVPLCETPLGLPQWWTALGGLSNGQPVDGINYAGRIGAGAGSPIPETWRPSFFVRFLGRHAGTTMVICGGYQSGGVYGSVSSEAGPGRIGAAWASRANPALPISVVSVASRIVTTEDDFANCHLVIGALSPGLALIQDFSNHNGTSINGYRAQVQTVAQYAQSLGTQPIIYIGYAEASADIGGLPAAGASSGTQVTLATGVTSVAAHGALVQGPGVAPGTTADVVPGGWFLTLSHAANIAAGSELRFVEQVASVKGTKVALQAPSYITGSGIEVTASGVQPGTTMTAKLGSTRATLSRAASMPPGTIPTLSVATGGSVNGYVEAAQWFYAATDSWATTQLDGLRAAGSDPNHFGWLCDGCSTVGGYANDYGNSLIAAKLVTLLQQLTGQKQQAAE